MSDLLAAVNALDVDEIAALPLPEALAIWCELEEANRILALVRSLLPNALAPQWGEKQIELPGVGVFVLHAKKNRTKWNSEDLYRAVKDTRIVDEKTGEVLSQLAVVEKVYPHAGYQARLTALREIGLDPDEFCSSEWAGYSIEKAG
jgi:hypothetical protein